MRVENVGGKNVAIAESHFHLMFSYSVVAARIKNVATRIKNVAIFDSNIHNFEKG